MSPNVTVDSLNRLTATFCCDVSARPEVKTVKSKKKISKTKSSNYLYTINHNYFFLLAKQETHVVVL